MKLHWPAKVYTLYTVKVFKLHENGSIPIYTVKVFKLHENEIILAIEN